MNSIIEVIKNNKEIVKKVAIAGGVLFGGLIVKNVLKNAVVPTNETYHEVDITEEETYSETERAD